MHVVGKLAYLEMSDAAYLGQRDPVVATFRVHHIAVEGGRGEHVGCGAAKCQGGAGIHLNIVVEDIVVSKPFCDLVRFRRESVVADARNDPRVLIVAPMSGHFSTLLRGTVEAMLPEHDVYITDWIDARNVPLAEGAFDLADYTDYIIEFCEYLAKDGERPSVMAVCQPGVPVLVAGSLMAEDDNPARWRVGGDRLEMRR